MALGTQWWALEEPLPPGPLPPGRKSPFWALRSHWQFWELIETSKGLRGWARMQVWGVWVFRRGLSQHETPCLQLPPLLTGSAPAKASSSGGVLGAHRAGREGSPQPLDAQLPACTSRPQAATGSQRRPHGGLLGLHSTIPENRLPLRVRVSCPGKTGMPFFPS